MGTALELLRELRTAKLSEADTKKSRTLLPEWLGRVTHSEFAASGRVLRVYSDVLCEEVLIAADNAELSQDERRVVYRASELPELLDITPEGLRLLHGVKTVFEGSTVLRRPKR